MFAYEFMRYAFRASTFIAITCGVIGVYVVARSFSFLTHTLNETGSAGAALAVFMGISPLRGMPLFTLLGSLGVGELSIHSNQKESSISAISASFIGLGVLFLSLAGSNSRYAANTLFGSIIGVDLEGVVQLTVLSLLVLIIIAIIQRQLNFDSFDHIGTLAHNVNASLVGIIFSIVMAMVVSVGSQVIGSLSVFILLTLPASTARYLGKTVSAMIAWSVGLAPTDVWVGLYLGFITNWPVTFFISVIEVLVYLTVYLTEIVKR